MIGVIDDPFLLRIFVLAGTDPHPRSRNRMAQPPDRCRRNDIALLGYWYDRCID
jgi:hypothetical protein